MKLIIDLNFEGPDCAEVRLFVYERLAKELDQALTDAAKFFLFSTGIEIK